jgi:hypothetical protein
LADSGHDGANDDGGFDDEAAGSIGGDNDPFGAVEEFADADAAAIVDVEDYGLRFHGVKCIPPWGNVKSLSSPLAPSG